MSAAASLTAIFFLLEGLFILTDEIFCHHRRVIPKWELISHPIDTICLFLFFISLRSVAPGAHQWAVLGLGLFSCFVTTKDEWVHSRRSHGFEHWLHAVLFLLHAWVVALFFWLWLSRAPELQSLVTIAAGATLIFLFINVRKRSVDGGTQCDFHNGRNSVSRA